MRARFGTGKGIEDMDNAFWASLSAGYQWQLSLITGIGIIAVIMAGKLVARMVPTLRAAADLNRDTYAKKMENPRYAANQAWNRKWGVTFTAIIFGAILPFCLTAEPQPWWRVIVDCVVILMVYDFFYYLMHRFLFHDSSFLGGPLMGVHAYHHRQHNPCRNDSSYIHPLEVALGLGLYVVCIFGLSFVMGNFSVVTVVVTWVAFSQINLHNHDLWTVDRFPFRTLNTMSVMHHNHHARFTGGNFATITLLYDWMFGTLDRGEGYEGAAYKPRGKGAGAEAEAA
jgi:sterol desaturase/sphingolipid hydroxylase (fatty acid hydroxylase superfamily)